MEEKIANKYILREFIGKGKFGSVYKGEKTDGKIVAIKFEPKDTAIPLLKKEARILEYLARNGLREFVPIVYWYGLHRDSICIVMSYFGNGNLSSDSLENWFQSAISLLEKIHFYGVIHRDLKPGHFIWFGNTWKLIDFGFACFCSDDIISNSREYVIGSPNYISLNVHNGGEPGKKDDMISLGYIFLEKYRGYLPWSHSDITSLNYPVNHLKHPANQFRRSLKEPAIFLQEIADIPILVSFMKKYYT